MEPPEGSVKDGQKRGKPNMLLHWPPLEIPHKFRIGNHTNFGSAYSKSISST